MREGRIDSQSFELPESQNGLKNFFDWIVFSVSVIELAFYRMQFASVLYTYVHFSNGVSRLRLIILRSVLDYILDAKRERYIKIFCKRQKGSYIYYCYEREIFRIFCGFDLNFKWITIKKFYRLLNIFIFY